MVVRRSGWWGRVRDVGLVVAGVSAVVLFVDVFRWRLDHQVSVWWWVAAIPGLVMLAVEAASSGIDTWRDPERDALSFWNSDWRSVMLAVLAPILGASGLIGDSGGPWPMYLGFLVFGLVALAFTIRQFLKPVRAKGRGPHRPLR